MKKLVLALTVIAISCQPAKEDITVESANNRTEVELIVDKAIEVAGGDNYLNSIIEFDFRDISYVGKRRGGLFSYERIITDSAGIIHDVLTNDSFTRKLNKEVVDVIDSMAQKYTNSVNSVLYFALLPYGLNDPAVFKSKIGESTIEGVKYDKVRVTFQEEGGGVDYQDVFVYWINKETSFVDYFGYTYETDGGGVRFRKAYNQREVGGIRVQDYVNYRPQDGDTTAIEHYDRLYTENKLVELSRIELLNVKVGPY